MKQQQLIPDDEWNWRRYFSRQMLAQAESDEKNGFVDDFHEYPDGKGARCVTARGFHVEVYTIPTTPEELEAYPDWNYLRGGILSVSRNTLPGSFSAFRASMNLWENCLA